MLEQAVRPWVNPGALVRNNIISDRTKISKERARIVWGAVGTLPTAQKEAVPTTTYNFKLQACNDTYKEQSRKQKKIKVEQAGVPENYVMIDQIETIGFAHTTDAQLLSSFSTDTTAFADFTITPTATTNFGSTSKTNQCVATYTLSGP